MLLLLLLMWTMLLMTLNCQLMRLLEWWVLQRHTLTHKPVLSSEILIRPIYENNCWLECWLRTCSRCLAKQDGRFREATVFGHTLCNFALHLSYATVMSYSHCKSVTNALHQRLLTGKWIITRYVGPCLVLQGKTASLSASGAGVER